MTVPIDRKRLERALNPRTIVVVGDKGPGFMWLSNQKQFTGEVCSVQLDAKEIEGIEERGYTNYTSLLDVPGEVDLVICAVPRQVTPFVVADAIEKGVGGISMFTSGFAETDEPEGIELEQRIAKMALDAGMPLVGPNCMGVYNRRLGVKFMQGQEQGDGGTVSIIGQSGTHAIGMTSGLQAVGVKVSRAISIGNAVVLNECDYLDYLLDDDDTEVIAMYLEGARDGRRFFELMRRARGRKPVVVWRGGLTGAGARAAHSHTGSLASSLEVWNALMRQTGAITADTLEEVVDIVSALVHAKEARGRNMALVAMTGGHSVAISDAFERAGLHVPTLSEHSYERLAEFFVTIGGSYRNPFDAAWTVGEQENLEKLLDILAEEPVIDGGIAIELNTGGYDSDPERLEGVLDLLDRYRERTGRPVIALVPAGGIMSAAPGSEAATKSREAIVGHGIALYPSFQRAAEALARVVDYRESLDAD